MRRAIVLLALHGAATARADPLQGADAERARQLARILEIDPQIEFIRRAPPPTTAEESIARLNTVEQAIIELSRAGLAVDATLARLQHEEFEAKNAHDYLQSRLKDSLTRWNLAAVLIGNGVSIVGEGMQFGNETVAKIGDLVTIAGSAVAAAFSIVALVKRNVGPLPMSIETNLLAPFFDRPSTSRSRYPDWLWRYLDTPLPGEKGSIRQQLIEKWTLEQRLPRANREGDSRRIDLLTKPLTKADRVDAAVLDDRDDMLADVRERVASLSVELEILWSEVHARR